MAKQCDPLPEAPTRQSTIGFHHDVILGLADTIVEAVKAGKISRFFVIGGCDGAEVGRNYFSDYAQATPPDSFILTLGCGKYRIRDYEYGELLGLPRLLDMGQCNNAYGAIRVGRRTGQGVRLHGQRPALDDRPLLVRAEGRRRVVDAALPRRARHHGRPQAAGVSQSQRVRHPSGEIRLAAQRQKRPGRPRRSDGRLSLAWRFATMTAGAMAPLNEVF